MSIWYILWSFGNSVKIWYAFNVLVCFQCFGILCQEKSGNPDGAVGANFFERALFFNLRHFFGPKKMRRKGKQF
jgi:hypothetical protein